MSDEHLQIDEVNYSDEVNYTGEAEDEEVTINAIQSQTVNHYFNKLNEYLIDADINSDSELVKLIVTSGENLIKTAMENTRNNGNIELEKFIIDTTVGNLTWLNWHMINACSRGHIEIVKLLIDKGANDWDVGILTACNNGHTDIVELILNCRSTKFNRCPSEDDNSDGEDDNSDGDNFSCGDKSKIIEILNLLTKQNIERNIVKYNHNNPWEDSLKLYRWLKWFVCYIMSTFYNKLYKIMKCQTGN